MVKIFIIIAAYNEEKTIVDVIKDLKKKGKGRPLHIYKPAAPLSHIVKKFEQEKLSEIESIEKELSELKHLITKK